MMKSYQINDFAVPNLSPYSDKSSFKFQVYYVYFTLFALVLIYYQTWIQMYIIPLIYTRTHQEYAI